MTDLETKVRKLLAKLQDQLEVLKNVKGVYVQGVNEARADILEELQGMLHANQ